MRCTTAVVALVLALAGAASTAGSPPGSRWSPRDSAATATLAPRDPAATAALAPRGPGAGPLTPSALAFPTPTDGWVVAGRGVAGGEVLATRDGGGSWSTQWSGALILRQVVATDSNHAWVLGQACERCRSVLIGTSDGGAHWSVLAEPPVRVNQLAFLSARRGVAAAQDPWCRETSTHPPPVCPGWVLETGDGGRVWRTILKTAEPIVAVAAGDGRLWAVGASPRSTKLGLEAHPPSLVVFSSRDGGTAWTAAGAVHPDMIAGLDIAAQLVPRPDDRLWLSALDRESCAMHGCGLAEGWSSLDGGRRWNPLAFPSPFERGIGMPCAAGQPIIAAGFAAVSFGFQSCAGPPGALYRLRGGHATVLHVWRRFDPTALASPAPTVVYALGTDPRARYIVQRSTDSGRTWQELRFAR